MIDSTTAQTQRLERLVNDMLDVSRTPTDLSTLVYGVLDRFAHQLDAAGCVLTTQIVADVVANIDASRVEQVVANFITNVLKYAPKSPVQVDVQRVGHMAKVAVHDAGKGVALEHQERIFGRFERATSANEVSGLGLGLYICKQIIEGHDGKIYVESTQQMGSNFCFEIPLFASNPDKHRT